MNFKKLTTLAMIAILSTSLVACSSKGEGGSTKNKEVTVGVWNGNQGEEKALTQMISEFEGKTGIKVKKKIYTDYNTQLKTDLIGETAPDVFYLDVNLSPEMMDSGVLEPLNQYVDEEYDVNDIYPNLINGFKDESGETYAMPKDYSSLSVYYNESLLEQAGYTKDDIPTELKKWPEFFSELQSKLPEGKKAAMIDPLLPRIMGFVEANGGEVVDSEGYSNLSDPKVTEALDLVNSLYQNGSTQQASELGYGWNGDAFGSEAGAIMIEGNWVVGHLRDNFPNVKYGTLEMPTYKGEKSNLLFTVGYAMNKKSKNKESAWEFIKYATGKEGMTIWTTGSGTLPSRKSIAVDTKVNENDVLKSHIAGADYGTVWQKGLTLPIIDREFSNWMPAVILGNETLEDAMKKATETANKDIDAQMK
ncbi:ABC transporter substrate-binding protein [Clostridioides difficile]|uniref:ABC transporter substrate-binding protein n=1 Tax=Clostridioides difficile TaxID=1496 RepID=UPI0021C899A5|nr:ABC transporter substrate-binding protein [Clostridioides difficile]UUV13244.1 ABC transporter substrate-binding protein [Clostridioides difficile]